MINTMLGEVKVLCSEDIGPKQAQALIDRVQMRNHNWLAWIDIITDEEDPNFVTLTYRFKKVPFERIRRITGYLVGSMDNWNDAKTAEEKDRVKHDTNIEKI